MWPRGYSEGERLPAAWKSALTNEGRAPCAAFMLSLGPMDKRSTLLVPVAIVIAGVLLAFGIYFARGGSNPVPTGDVSLVRPISPDEHLVGNPEAKVTVVEYSDIDCTYCKEFQATMTQIMADYAAEGTVAWAYRHFPLVNAHPYAAKHAEAAECVAALGGNDRFFRFIDALQAAAPGSMQFDPNNYAQVVGDLGVSESDFAACLSGGTMIPKVTADFDNAIEAGASGSPYIVLLVKGSDPIAVSGALPYDAMRRIIDEALKKAR